MERGRSRPQQHLGSDYLIDDRPNKCEADMFEGEAIAFDSTQFLDWEAVTDYLLRKQNYV